MMKNRHILIIDDQENNRKILGHILEDEYDILSAEGGEEALRILRANSDKLSAVFLDLIMPGMDGYQVLFEMKKDRALCNIPVIIASQMDSEESETRVLSMGANDFVGKPYKAQIIRQRLKNLITMKEASENLATAERDILTGLYDKRAFFRKVSDMLYAKSGVSFDLIQADIEKFKIYNSAFGYSEGDRLLKYVAGIIDESFHGENEITCRYAGDKFFICVPRTPHIQEVLLKIHDEVGEYPLTRDVIMKFAIYHIQDIHLPLTNMCDATALALSEIKGQYGRIVCEYDDSLRKGLMKEQKIASIMKDALEKKQFQIYFQPKYDIRNENMVGAEALARWIQPDLGLISPAEFIPIFERNGFITELDKYIWEKACQFISNTLQQRGSCVPVSVNMSRKDIYMQDLPEFLLELVQRYQLEPKYLHLEITETAYTENTMQLVQVIERLKQYGFVIEMDDFGSGYSSLNILSELPIDVLKLDMKFIQNEQNHKNSNNIMSSIITLAKWMNLLVIAEGVETEEQVAYLKNLRCNFIQGYYYSQPLPENEFMELLHSSRLEPLFNMDSFVEIENGDESSKRRDGTIVVVDDLKMNLMILADCLKDDYSIVKADNGAIAWNYLQENYEHISMVVTDLYMPVMSGDELLVTMKEHANTRDIPVIVTSAKADMKLIGFLQEHGAAAFLRKPFDKEEILQLVSDTLERQTKLYNRGTFEHKINDYFARKPQGKGLFIILDIDNFKMVNDSLGHTVGDETIQKVAELIRAFFDSQDVLCRMGGDEFGIFLMQRFTQEELREKLEELRKKLQFQVEHLQLSCSIGVCQSPQYASDYQSLYEKADTALLTAKRMGKNQFQIYGLDLHIPAAIMGRNFNWLLDEASDAIVVSDAETYDLYYLNRVASEQLAKKENHLCVGRKCYEVIFHRDEPCETCISCNQLTTAYQQYYMTDEKTGRTFAVKDKRIEWTGNPARIQFLQDVTKEHHLETMIRNILKKTGLEEKNPEILQLLEEIEIEKRM